jgi:antitoxin HicB
MTGNEFLDRLRRLAERRGCQFLHKPDRGKGSHGSVWFGDFRTVMPDPRRELKKGRYRACVGNSVYGPRTFTISRNRMPSIAYRCHLEPDEDGGYVATFPDLPYGATQGETVAATLTEASDLLESILATLVDDELDIPDPTTADSGEHLVSPSAVTAAQVALYTAMRREKVSPDELARRLAVSVSDIRRLTDLSTYPPLEKIERALAALGHRLRVALEAAE